MQLLTIEHGSISANCHNLLAAEIYIGNKAAMFLFSICYEHFCWGADLFIMIALESSKDPPLDP